MGCSSTGSAGGEPQPMESNSKEFDYCFRQDEISYIKKAKKNREEGVKNEEEGGEEGGEEEERAEIKKDAIFNIYKKIELDVSKNVLKEYLVLYIPEEYTKDTITYTFLPAYRSIFSQIEKLGSENKYLKYGKKNNDTKAVTKFECVPEPEIVDSYKCSIEFKLTEKDKQTKLVTIEFLDETADVYDIEVEDNHNFALDAGVFVHNSKDISDSVCGAMFNASKHAEEFAYDYGETAEEILKINTGELIDDRQQLTLDLENELQKMYQERNKQQSLDDDYDASKRSHYD